ncbi:MAG: DUF5684 domain-containing protein [Lachnospiraceae bacterium]|nr:DUF5684 domain-containing protein [Lachnospiraceae bacterium]
MSENMILALLVGAGATYLLASCIWWVLQVVANWKIFDKAGEAGWKSIIPFYSGYISYKIAWNPMFFWISLITGCAASGLNAYYEETNGSPVMIFIALALLIISIVINVKFCVKLSKAFGKGMGFAFGLLILNPLFILILGLGKSEYVGNQS